MEIFRAYDIRREYPKDINDEICYKIDRLLVRTFNAKNVVIGRDFPTFGNPTMPTEKLMFF